MFYDFTSIGKNIPNWRTHIFQRGRSTTNQTVTFHIPICVALIPFISPLNAHISILPYYHGYLLVNMQKTMENHHHFQWVNPPTKWPFSIAMLNYQRVWLVLHIQANTINNNREIGHLIPFISPLNAIKHHIKSITTILPYSYPHEYHTKYHITILNTILI